MILNTSNSLTSQYSSPLVNFLPNTNVFFEELSQDCPLFKVLLKYISG